MTEPRHWFRCRQLVGGLGLALAVFATSIQARPFADRVDDLYDVMMDIDHADRAELCSAYPDLENSRDARDWVSLQEATCRTLLIDGDPHPDMHFYAARLLYRSGLLRDQVYEDLQKGAEKGSVQALTALAWMEYTRNEDDEAMVEAYERAAEQGDPVAMTELARYVDRLGYMRRRQQRPDDDERARELLERASAQGYPPADLLLGRFHFIQRNDATAERYLRAAAEAGVEEAYRLLEREGHEVERPADGEYRYPSHQPWDLVMYRRPEHAPPGAYVRQDDEAE